MSADDPAINSAQDPNPNVAVTADYWAAHFRRDWDAMMAFFTDDVHYDDIGAAGAGARGPEELINMLRLGLDPLDAYIHHPRQMVAQGDVVVTEHAEEWQFHTGEAFTHPYVSIFTFRDGKIARWHDYSNLENITANVPQWWIEHVSKGF